MSGQRFTRRRFVGGAGALVVGAAFVPAARGLMTQSQPAAELPVAESPSLDLTAFAALRGQRFSTTELSGSKAVDLKLETVTEWSPHGSPGAGAAHGAALVGGEYFTLTFSGPASQMLEQETYQLQHDRAGSFPLFIVPGARSDTKQMYAAVIGRLPA